MSIRDLLTENSIITDMKAQDKKSALVELCNLVSKNHSMLDQSQLLSILLDRERLGSTGIGCGVAIPHGKISGIDSLLTAFGRSSSGIDFASMDDQPAHLFFVLFAPKDACRKHLDALASVSCLLQNQDVRDRLMEASDALEILDILRNAEEIEGASKDDCCQ